jgi:hypothetical protein
MAGRDDGVGFRGQKASSLESLAAQAVPKKRQRERQRRLPKRQLQTSKPLQKNALMMP